MFMHRDDAQLCYRKTHASPLKGTCGHASLPPIALSPS